jgi:hypothetical protein
MNNRKYTQTPIHTYYFSLIKYTEYFLSIKGKYSKQQGNCINTISFEQSLTFEDKIGYCPIGIEIYAMHIDILIHY